MGVRVLVLHLPAFRLERCGYLAEEVAALTAEQKSAVRLVALTPAAREAGLRVGMTATDARARCPEVLLEPWDEAGEALDRQALLQALVRLSDRVFPIGEDFALAADRTAALFGGEEALLREAKALVADLGHACRAAVAEEPLAAAALAGWGPDEAVVAAEEAAAALAPLPIEALRPSEALRLALATLGIDRIGDWARLDPASVAGRFGAEGVRLHRVARGLSCEDGPDPAWQEVEPIVVRAVLAEASTTLQPVHFVLPGLLRQVSEALRTRDAAAVRLALRFVLDQAPVHTLRVRVGRPTRDVVILERVIRTRLQTLRLQAPVVELQLEVEEATTELSGQVGLVDRSGAREAMEDLLARLIDALGEAALFTPERVEDWCPERAWRPGELGAPPPPRRRVDRVDPVDAIEAFEQRVPQPRPSLLLPRPQPIQVRVEEGRPARVHLDRGWERVLDVEGPERLRGAWWSETQTFDRSYWVVRVGRGTGWLFEEHARWYWHGWFD